MGLCARELLCEFTAGWQGFPGTPQAQGKINPPAFSAEQLVHKHWRGLKGELGKGVGVRGGVRRMKS